MDNTLDIRFSNASGGPVVASPQPLAGSFNQQQGQNPNAPGVPSPNQPTANNPQPKTPPTNPPTTNQTDSQKAIQDRIDKQLLENYRKALAEQQKAIENQKAIQDRIDKVYLESYRKALEQQKEREKLAEAEFQSQITEQRIRDQQRQEAFEEQLKRKREQDSFDQKTRIAGGFGVAVAVTQAVNTFVQQKLTADVQRIRGQILESQLTEKQATVEAVGAGAQIAGGVAGFALGGPVGAVIGSLAGTLVKGIGELFTQSDRRFLEQQKAFSEVISRVSQFSGPLARETALSQAQETKRTLAESEVLGGRLADLEAAKRKLDDAQKLTSILENMETLTDQIKKTEEKTQELLNKLGSDEFWLRAYGFGNKADELKARREEIEKKLGLDPMTRLSKILEEFLARFGISKSTSFDFDFDLPDLPDRSKLTDPKDEANLNIPITRGF